MKAGFCVRRCIVARHGCMILLHGEKVENAPDAQFYDATLRSIWRETGDVFKRVICPAISLRGKNRFASAPQRAHVFQGDHLCCQIPPR